MLAVEVNVESLERAGQDRTRNEARVPESMSTKGCQIGRLLARGLHHPFIDLHHLLLNV